MLQSHVSNPPEEMVARSGHCYLVLPLLMHLIPTICTSNPLVESLSLQVVFQWRPELFRSFGACTAYTRLRQPVATTISEQENAAPAKAKTQDVEMSESGDSRSGIRLVSSDTNSFEPSTGLSTLQAEDLFKVHGPNELPEKKDPYWLIFLRLLIEPMPCMIWVAAITEAAIQNWPDMGILLGIQFLNASLGFYEITKAGNAVAELQKSLKPEATVKRDGKWAKIHARYVVPGDLVLLGSGSAIPADCLVNDGRIEVDQSAMTGESMAVTMYRGSSCKMGSMVTRGEVEATVQHTGENTFFGKTATMLQGSNEVGNLQKVLMKIMMILVIISFALSGIVFSFLLSKGADVRDSISFTVVLIVASIPIAIEIVCTTTLALGSHELSQKGAIVTRLAAIEDMAGMNMLCSDKTGTLTKNKMEIQEETPIYLAGETQYTCLRYAAMATKWQEPARDALDTMTHAAADLDSLDSGDLAVEQIDFLPFDPTIKRTEGTVKVKKTGKVFKTTKGAPNIIMAMTGESEEVKKKIEEDVTDLSKRGIRAMAIGITDQTEDDWKFVGLLTFLDPPRSDTKETIHLAMKFGVEVKMITGDHLLIAIETSKALDLGERVPGRAQVVPHIRGAEGLPMLDPETKKAPAGMTENFGDYIRHGHGFAQVYPEHKYLIVQVLRELGFRVGMTGDGVNDAPALHIADVGIAVADATDAARAASDIVLTEEGLSCIVDGIIIARCIFQRMKNFIIYRIAATLQLLVFFFLAVLCFQPVNYQPDNVLDTEEMEWPTFFRMPVLMLMLITLLNDGTLISVGYDHVEPSQLPNEWNLPVVFTVSSLLAGVALVSSLLLLFFCLDSWNPNSAFDLLGIGGIQYGEITTVMYLKVSISDFLTLFSSRASDKFFWCKPWPSNILICAACFALFLSTLLACVWPAGSVDGMYVQGLATGGNKALAFWVWLYCLFWWLVQDAAKVALFKFMHANNTFGINNVSLGEGLLNADSVDSLTNPLLDEESGGRRSDSTPARKI